VLHMTVYATARLQAIKAQMQFCLPLYSAS